MIVVSGSSSSTITLWPSLSIQRTDPPRSDGVAKRPPYTTASTIAAVPAAAPIGARPPARRASRLARRGTWQARDHGVPQVGHCHAAFEVLQGAPQRPQRGQLAPQRGAAPELALEAPTRQRRELAVVVGVQPRLVPFG